MHSCFTKDAKETQSCTKFFSFIKGDELAKANFIHLTQLNLHK